MKKTIYLLISAFLLLMASACHKKNQAKASAGKAVNSDSSGYHLVWSDEFNYQGLPDSTKWTYDVGGSGWGNQEEEYYTSKRPENARVENGDLIIEARRDNWEGHEYTSARLVTRGKAMWKYGKILVRAKLPMGRGTWPAIWLLPDKWGYGNGGWPDNGDIDIMEMLGYKPGYIFASIHTKDYNWVNGSEKSDTVKIRHPDALFHVYGLEWTPDDIRISVDGHYYFNYKKTSDQWQKWPFNKKFYLILNIAIGGIWGGRKGIDNSAFPQKMIVDYVRVYQKKNTVRKILSKK